MPCRIYASAVGHSKQVFTVPPSAAHEFKKHYDVGHNSRGGCGGHRGRGPPHGATRRVFAPHHNAHLYAYSHRLPVATHHNICLYAYSYHLPVAYHDIRAESAERFAYWGRLDVCGASDVYLV